MNEEIKGLQAQIDLMSQALQLLVNAAELDRKLKTRLHRTSKELSVHPDPAIAKAAASWGQKWFPHEPFMDDPLNQ